MSSQTAPMQPEVGQMLFGCATGRFDCPDYVRAFLSHILREIERVYWNRNQKSWEQESDPGIPGVTFRPYYWGDCVCGFDEREEEWSESHNHAPDCYQSEIRAGMAAWEARNGYSEIEAAAFGPEGISIMGGFDSTVETPAPGVTVWTGAPRKDEAMRRWRKASTAHHKAEDRLRRSLCAKLGLSYPSGCAVHCTCTHQGEWVEWRSANDHAPTCGIVAPNFAFEAVEIRWYKHPGRGVSVNVDWSERQWREWLDRALRCVREADPAIGGPAPIPEPEPKP